jgi:prevent-host-death family protein
MTTMEVGIRELKARLSSYVARARRGESVVVTDRGRPVARLQPVETDEPPAAVRALALAGRLVYKGRLNPAALPAPIRLRGGGKDSTDYVREGRR